MKYFNYHAQVQKLIKNGLLLSYHFDNNYKKIGMAMILNFKYKTYPIREGWFDFYKDYIFELYNVKKHGELYITTLK